MPVLVSGGVLEDYFNGDALAGPHKQTDWSLQVVIRGAGATGTFGAVPFTNSNSFSLYNQWI